MPKQALAANSYRIWAFGREYSFQVATLSFPLTPGGHPLNQTRYQKRQIFLHCTTGSVTGEAEAANWFNSAGNTDHVASQYYLEQNWVGQVGRNPAPAGTVADTPGFTDAVRFCDDSVSVGHAQGYNTASIGIEISNVATNWTHVARNPEREPTYQAPHTGANCPQHAQINGAGPFFCIHGRPQDENRWYRMPNNRPATAYGGEFLGFEEEQYHTLILLLRHLCIAHRIPRRFPGHTVYEALLEYRSFPGGNGATQQAKRRETTSRISHFSGILFHRNVTTKGKSCPGPIHRDRLFRGVIDEWWMPVEYDAPPRTYYSGPFHLPEFIAGQRNRNMYFRAEAGGAISGCTLLHADIASLMETKSYFNIDNANEYYSLVETRNGGMFPVGANKIWHGGIHIPVPAASPFVYATASGTIVAARVSSNPDTESDPKFGSQRFVLVRHAVYMETEADPNVPGQQRIRYSLNGTVQPTYVFSLYMHLAPLSGNTLEERQNPARDDNNPPWFNLWRESHPADNVGLQTTGSGADQVIKGRVFAPNIEVSVGDIIGRAGILKGSTQLHFEIISNTGLTMAPWNDLQLSPNDTNRDAACDNGLLDVFLTDVQGDGIDIVDILRAAPGLRNAKTRHLSEWAITSSDQIEPVVPNADQREALWLHWRNFSWFAEALAANTDLPGQLGQDGIFWHYHPITFMKKVNELIQGENREIPEEQDTGTNVTVDEEGYIVSFVRWDAGTQSLVAQPSNGTAIHPDKNGNFSFVRNDVGCIQCITNRPGNANNPTTTKFSLFLLDIIERIRKHYNSGIAVRRSYVCAACGAAHGTAQCCSAQAAGVAAHQNGLAVDFTPSGLNAANCQNLWNSTRFVVNAYNQQADDAGGSPSDAAPPPGYSRLQFRAYPNTAENQLSHVPQQAPAPFNSFCIHLELVATPVNADAADTTPLPIRLRLVFQKITIIDDSDWFGKGEWNLTVTVNGQTFRTFNQSVSTGETIPLTDWIETFEIPAEGSLHIVVKGVEKDLIWDDSLGEATAAWSRASTPSWGIGTPLELRNSQGNYVFSYSVESVNTDY